MASDIVIAGVTYPDVPAVVLRDTNNNDVVFVEDPFFNVSAELNLATMQISNISESFADAMDALNDGKTVKLSLSYTSPIGVTEHALSFSSRYRSDHIFFSLLMAADLGYGTMPYMFDIWWNSVTMALNVYPLAVLS